MSSKPGSQQKTPSRTHKQVIIGRCGTADAQQSRDDQPATATERLLNKLSTDVAALVRRVARLESAAARGERDELAELRNFKVHVAQIVGEYDYSKPVGELLHKLRHVSPVRLALLSDPQFERLSSRAYLTGSTLAEELKRALDIELTCEDVLSLGSESTGFVEEVRDLLEVAHKVWGESKKTIHELVQARCGHPSASSQVKYDGPAWSGYDGDPARSGEELPF